MEEACAIDMKKLQCSFFKALQHCKDLNQTQKSFSNRNQFFAKQDWSEANLPFCSIFLKIYMSHFLFLFIYKKNKSN